MRMRLVPRRGEKFSYSGEMVTILEAVGIEVRVILDNGKTTMVPKSYLNLPIIDTKDYEKI